MKYLYPYECERERLSTPDELQQAIDGNRREGRRSSYGQYGELLGGDCSPPPSNQLGVPQHLNNMQPLSGMSASNHAAAAAAAAAAALQSPLGPLALQQLSNSPLSSLQSSNALANLNALGNLSLAAVAAAAAQAQSGSHGLPQVNGNARSNRRNHNNPHNNSQGTSSGKHFERNKALIIDLETGHWSGQQRQTFLVAVYRPTFRR
jgi:hypothetical protein